MTSATTSFDNFDGINSGCREYPTLRTSSRDLGRQHQSVLKGSAAHDQRGSTHALFAVGWIVVRDVVPSHRRGLAQYIPVLLSFLVDANDFGLHTADT